MITSTGDGLTILISCEYTFAHHWMSFISWYFCSKNLPDAKVIVCPKKTLHTNLFGWTLGCHVPCILHREESPWNLTQFADKKPLLIIMPDIIPLLEFEEKSEFVKYLENTPKSNSDKMWLVNDPQANSIPWPDSYVPAKENKNSTFVSYGDGWGKFVTSAWINKKSNPFSIRYNFASLEMTDNEEKIEKLWKNLSFLFRSLVS